MIVAPMTAAGHAYLFRPACHFSGKTGRVALDQLRTGDSERLRKRLGTLSPSSLATVFSTPLGAPPFATAYLAYAYGRSGDRARALATIEKLNRMSPHGEATPFNLALAYLGLGDRARALDYLEKAYAANSELLVWLKIDRIFDPLRSEPRWVALMKELHF